MPPLRLRAARLALAAVFIVPLLMIVRLPAGRADGRLAWPVGGTVTRGFEKPSGPYGEGGHQGIDIAAPPGTPVTAAAAGTVSWVGEVPRGLFVSIAHGGSLRTTYLDVRDVTVRRGQAVVAGQRIAAVAGSRDVSSPSAHLHFDTYLGGQPVDPLRLLGGRGFGSFVRLCPVETPVGAGDGRAAAGLWPGAGSGRETAHPPNQGDGGAPALWRGACELGRGVARLSAWAWDRVLFPAGRAVARLCQAAWGNRYVRAVTAGLAAALLVVAGVIVVFLLLPVSAVTAAIAAVAGSLVCLGVAVYYAATSGSGFAFASCFLKCLAAGAVAASGVIAWSALGASLAAGWAKVGLAGALKAASWNGVFSVVFDSGLNYLLTGRFSPGRAAVAFLVGSVSGAVGKVIKAGIRPETFVRLLSFTGRAGTAVSVGPGVSVLVRQVAVRMDVFMSIGRRLALDLGGKVAYVLAWGSLCAGLDVLACVVGHRPVTAAGTLSCFTAGVAMGAIALCAGGTGISGMLARFKVFRRGAGAFARSLVARVVGKGVSRGLDRGVEWGLKRLLREKEAGIE